MSTSLSSANQTGSNLDDLASLVTGISRFLTGLAALEPFQHAQIGLAEWSALFVLMRKGELNNKQLAIALGVSTQRANQLTESLLGSSLISLRTSSEDRRKKIISINAAGTKRLNEVNAKLEARIVTALEKRPQVLRGASRAINRRLMRMVAKQKDSAT